MCSSAYCNTLKKTIIKLIELDICNNFHDNKLNNDTYLLDILIKCSRMNMMHSTLWCGFETVFDFSLILAVSHVIIRTV